tara:strand:+ start:18951 stop:19667 length:717 start_codon:yes stop_codon:yes gene_type:complete
MIRIFQRHCNFSSNSHNKPRPDWFDREKIFDHFISTLDNRVEYTAFHDSGNGDIEDHFLNTKNVNKISKKGGNDAQSFLNLLNYVNEQNYDENDIIYFVEDDYLHHEKWIDIMLEGFEHIGADYYTLYDHPDKYEGQASYIPHMYENFTSKIIVTPSCHWRTVPSTTNTYACLVKTLKKHFPIHVQYCDLVEKWTKDYHKFIHLWNEGSNLLSCIPGYSSHIEGGMLSPVYDWENLIK